MAQVSDLPNELLRYLFQMLSSEDRKVALLVDRKWRRVGEDPVLWKWCIIKIKNGQDLNKLSVGRFKYIQQIFVYSVLNWQALEKLFQATLELPKLKEIKGVKFLDQSLVNSELLGKALGKLENLDINGNNITTDQIMAIFKEMAQKGCTKKLTFDFCSLLELEAEILSMVISGLQEFEIYQVSLTSNQVWAIFKSISQNSQLKKVMLHSLNVSSVTPELFGTAVTNIESVSLRDIKISPYQAESLFTEMEQNKKIKKFSAKLSQSSADPKLIARGLSKLEEVRLYGSGLTDEQVQAIFTELNQHCKLKVLELGWNDLSSVHPDVLSKVVNKFEVVGMSLCQLSEEQVTAVLTRAQQNTILKRLDITDNEISQVDPIILSTAQELIEDFYIDINEAFDFESDFEDEESEEWELYIDSGEAVDVDTDTDERSDEDERFN